MISSIIFKATQQAISYASSPLISWYVCSAIVLFAFMTYSRFLVVKPYYFVQQTYIRWKPYTSGFVDALPCWNTDDHCVDFSNFEKVSEQTSSPRFSPNIPITICLWIYKILYRFADFTSYTLAKSWTLGLIRDEFTGKTTMVLQLIGLPQWCRTWRYAFGKLLSIGES